MPTPSPAIVALLTTFAPAFTAPTFAHAQVLVYGTLLAVGRRTVTAALRAVGLAEERHVTTYHRVLNRAVWSPLTLSRLLLGLLVGTFLVPGAPLVGVIDETLERRWGKKIADKGRFRDAVRSRGSLSAHKGVYAHTPEISVHERSHAAVGRRRVHVATGRSVPACLGHANPRDRCALAHQGACSGERTRPHGNSAVFEGWHDGLCGPRLWLSAQGDAPNFPSIGSSLEGSDGGRA